MKKQPGNHLFFGDLVTKWTNVRIRGPGKKQERLFSKSRWPVELLAQQLTSKYHLASNRT